MCTNDLLRRPHNILRVLRGTSTEADHLDADHSDPGSFRSRIIKIPDNLDPDHLDADLLDADLLDADRLDPDNLYSYNLNPDNFVADHWIRNI